MVEPPPHKRLDVSSNLTGSTNQMENNMTYSGTIIRKNTGCSICNKPYFYIVSNLTKKERYDLHIKHDFEVGQEITFSGRAKVIDAGKKLTYVMKYVRIKV